MWRLRSAGGYCVLGWPVQRDDSCEMIKVCLIGRRERCQVENSRMRGGVCHLSGAVADRTVSPGRLFGLELTGWLVFAYSAV